MLSRFMRTLFGTANDRALKTFQRRVSDINALEPKMQALDDAHLANVTVELRQKLANGATSDDILPEAFAVTREASRRILGMRHFDVQLIGGMALHAGHIAEMRTGEGKTLVATLAVYLSALSGKGVHVVTVNDYLAARDADEMSKLYSFLGLSTGVIVPNMPDDARREAYAADITYGTNNELGFDYLRDNMKYHLSEMVQRPFHHAIVDEVDSILIDEARTPLIISGPAEDSSDLYRTVDAIVAQLVQDTNTFEKDEKMRSVILTERGSDQIEELLQAAHVLESGGLYDPHHIAVVHHVQQSLRAHTLFTRDVDYIVRNNKVIIIDEFTGRMMDGRRYSDGLHQALEAKEHVEIQQENQTLASITFQNFFRLYPKLSGMTGTAMTEADEFAEIYNLNVVAIPTNKPIQRTDEDDEIYLTEKDKFNAVVKLIHDVHERGQPILVGTTSIEKSEALSARLQQEKIPHHVLNARFHEMEAKIIAQAGTPGAVTIATNMAGRGTDIKLGGNIEMLIAQELGEIEDSPEREAAEQAIRDRVNHNHKIVCAAGGLYVIGTERHESRRIDNQLRGRSGRQGDPGNSRFFISLEDDLMRIFGSDRMGGLLQKMGLREGEPLVHPWLSKALERAQKKVEAHNFEMRRNTLKYDDVMNAQRKEVYAERREFMALDDVSTIIGDAYEDVIEAMVSRHIPEKSFVEQWTIPELTAEIQQSFGLDLPVSDWVKEEPIEAQDIIQRISLAVQQAQATRAVNIGPDLMRFIEKQILLTTYDTVWKEHLHALDQLRQGIGLRAYGQKDPLNEYKHEASVLFTYMQEELRHRIASLLARVEVTLPPPADPFENTASIHADPGILGYASEPGPGISSKIDPVIATPIGASAILPNDPSSWGETPRNAPCPCGSGLKYKHCHGRIH
ncbi:MAG: preprotein translocase subunit SecA [Acetobacter sp.]|nr:preprotein translocase subunit SecA [Acetobacter sp.]